MKQKTKAYLVEFTDGSTWEDGSIHWFVENALTSAEEIPYRCRIREVEVTLGDLVSRERILEAYKINKMFADLFDEESGWTPVKQ